MWRSTAAQSTSPNGAAARTRHSPARAFIGATSRQRNVLQLELHRHLDQPTRRPHDDLPVGGLAQILLVALRHPSVLDHGPAFRLRHDLVTAVAVESALAVGRKEEC